MARRLADLVADLADMGPAVHGSMDRMVSGLTDDSRLVRAGHLFAAHPGERLDGHDHIPDALAAGAAVIVHEQPVASYDPAATYVCVPDARLALSALSCRFYGDPSRDLVIVGVTGTKGKSTTTWYLAQLLLALGKPTGFVSSASLRIGEKVRANPSHVSTPMANDLHRMLREMVDAGNQYAVIEASSHALSPRTARLAHVPFDAAVLTNVTHEHLDFHHTMEQYRSDKANLFRALGRTAGRHAQPFGVVNVDDPAVGYFRAATGVPVLGYSETGAPADLRVVESHGTAAHTDALLAAVDGTPVPVRLATPGAFNLANLLAAVLTAMRLTGVSLRDLAPLVPDLRPVRGRMERIDAGQPFDVIVDFAHNPDSFEKVLSTMRGLARARLIALFGSAGDRDREKRPIQGEIASRYCEVLILADEDPRSESPYAILKQIAAGCVGHVEGQDLYLIPDRAVAVRHAMRLARPGDTVLLLGKGHETSIIYADRTVPWDEATAAREALRDLGYRA